MKILNYNAQGYFRRGLYKELSDHKQYMYLMDNDFSKNYFLYDRSGAIKHFLDIDSSYCPIPKTTPHNKDFYTICVERAKELLSLNKPINILWSGGLDSTMILFLMYDLANDKSQITVWGTYNSIIESGDLFDKYIKNNIKYNIRVNSAPEYNFNTNDDCIFVSGAMSNQLFTPGLKYNHNRDSLLRFKDGFDISNARDIQYNKVLTEPCLLFLHQAIQNSPKKIETLQDLRWFIIFNFTWYNVLTSSLISIGPEKSKKINCFFNSNDFQIWSIYNNDLATKTGDYSDERWQVRDIISNYMVDRTFSRDKKKFTSVIFPSPNNWMYLLNDYTNVYINEG